MTKKSLLLFFSLILSFQVLSRPPHERPALQNDFFDLQQHGKIKAAMLNDIDRKILSVKEFFESEQVNLGEPATHEEGRIRATIIIQVESGLNEVYSMRADLEEINSPGDDDLAPIQEKLAELSLSIEDLKL